MLWALNLFRSLIIIYYSYLKSSRLRFPIFKMSKEQDQEQEYHQEQGLFYNFELHASH